MPRHTIGRIRYFTALVTSRPGDPTQAQRQQAYLRALQTVPNLTIHYGHLLPKTKRRPLARRPRTGPRVVEILDTEEKGSDVNLASYLLLDGFEDEYELAVVISNAQTSSYRSASRARGSARRSACSTRVGDEASNSMTQLRGTGGCAEGH